MITLNPYLNFNRESKDAMEFYHSVLGGDLDVQTFEQSGMPDISEEDKDLVIHALLKSGEITIMASDGGKNHPVHMGDNVHMSLVGPDEETLTKWFKELSEGGKVDMPLAKQFWGDTYGQLTDKFGVHWTVNITSSKETQK